MVESKRLQVEAVSSHAYDETVNELRKEEYPMLNSKKDLYRIVDILLM